MNGFLSDEIIINDQHNFVKKLDYYLNTYDEKLNHKCSPGISIVNAASANSFDELQADLVD